MLATSCADAADAADAISGESCVFRSVTEHKVLPIHSCLPILVASTSTCLQTSSLEPSPVKMPSPHVLKSSIQPEASLLSLEGHRHSSTPSRQLPSRLRVACPHSIHRSIISSQIRLTNT